MPTEQELRSRADEARHIAELNKTDYGDMVCFCGHIRRDHGASSELGEEFYRPDACRNCGARVCDEFQWNGGGPVSVTLRI